MGSSLFVSGDLGGARTGRRASSLFYCRTARRYVVLDLHRDRYFALDADAIDAAGGLAAHPLLGAAVGPPVIVAASTSCGVETLDARPRAAITPHLALRFFWCARSAAWQLKRRPLEETIERFRRRKRACAASQAPLDFERVRRAAAVFARLRPWYPRNYECLFDSLALLEFLAASRLFASWVFAVQAEPFEAHCWVQAGGVVLNDALEDVRALTPILVL